MQEFLKEYPILIDFLVYMSVARMILKPTLSFLVRYVKYTPTKEDDKKLLMVINSIPFMLFEFLLDLFVSIKLPINRKEGDK